MLMKNIAQLEVENTDFGTEKNKSEKSFLTATVLALFLGLFAADRFYLGKYGTAVLKLITFGGYGIWWLLDSLLLITGETTDKQKHQLAGREENLKKTVILGIVALILAISAYVGVQLLAETLLKEAFEELGVIMTA